MVPPDPNQDCPPTPVFERIHTESLPIGVRVGISVPNDIQELEEFVKSIEEGRAVRQGEELAKFLKLAYAHSEHFLKLTSTEEHAPRFLNAIQTWLDRGSIKEDTRGKAITILVKLAGRSGHFPTSLFLRGVSVPDTSNPIAQGGSADIYKGRYKNDDVAVKRMRTVGLTEDAAKALFQAFCREALIWKQLSHENILPFLGVDRITFENYKCLVSPWMPNKTILDFVKSKNYEQSRDCTRLLYESAKGLNYLHEHRVVHGDFKDVNILVNANGNARITDFGLTIVDEATTGRTATASGLAGTIRWMAPERLSTETMSTRPTIAGDVYAFGLLFVTIYTEEVPFSSIKSCNQLLLHVMKGGHPSRQGTIIPDNIWECAEECWKEPINRPSMAEIAAFLNNLRRGNNKSSVRKLRRSAEIQSNRVSPGLKTVSLVTPSDLGSGVRNDSKTQSRNTSSSRAKGGPSKKRKERAPYSQPNSNSPLQTDAQGLAKGSIQGPEADLSSALVTPSNNDNTVIKSETLFDPPVEAKYVINPPTPLTMSKEFCASSEAEPSNVNLTPIPNELMPSPDAAIITRPVDETSIDINVVEPTITDINPLLPTSRTSSVDSTDLPNLPETPTTTGADASHDQVPSMKSQTSSSPSHSLNDPSAASTVPASPPVPSQTSTLLDDNSSIPSSPKPHPAKEVAPVTVPTDEPDPDDGSPLTSNPIRQEATATSEVVEQHILVTGQEDDPNRSGRAEISSPSTNMANQNDKSQQIQPSATLNMEIKQTPQSLTPPPPMKKDWKYYLTCGCFC